MSKTKKCYKCSTEAEETLKVCPRCNIKLGARKESGIAGKPDLPILKIIVAVLVIAVAGKIVGHSLSSNPAASPRKNIVLTNEAKDGLISKIKEKGSGELSALGVADIGYKDDVLRVYVTTNFSNLSRLQQEELVKVVANEWIKALGKDSTAVEIMEYGTNKTLDEWVLK